MGDTPQLLNSNHPAIGTQLIKTVRGPVLAFEVPGSATSIARVGTAEASVVLMLYDPKPDEGGSHGSGMLTQMDAAAARNFAASLWKLADQIDPLVRQ